MMERLTNGYFYAALDGWDYDAPVYPTDWSVRGGEGYWYDDVGYGSKVDIYTPGRRIGVKQSIDLSYPTTLTFNVYITADTQSSWNRFGIYIDGANYMHILNSYNRVVPVSYTITGFTGIHTVELAGILYVGSRLSFNISAASAMTNAPPPTFYPKWQTTIGPL